MDAEGLLCLMLFTAIVCGLAGSIVGSKRNAGGWGLLLGLLFGPIGVALAFLIDQRPQCPHCGATLPIHAKGYGYPVCSGCHTPIEWRLGQPVKAGEASAGQQWPNHVTSDAIANSATFVFRLIRQVYEWLLEQMQPPPKPPVKPPPLPPTM